MRNVRSLGGVRKQRGRWIGLWYEGGVKKSKTLGLVSEMTKGEAREAVVKIVTELRAAPGTAYAFGGFVEKVYFPFYRRKWKASTRANNVNRVRVHLVSVFGERELASFKRDELQDLLDGKAKTLSFSVVDHLRWDLKQIFDMAIAEGLIRLNPAGMLFTPREAKRQDHPVMSVEDVTRALAVLEERERLIVGFAVLGGMRPGEIFALRWRHIQPSHAVVEQRVYRGVLDSPKTHHSLRQVALSPQLIRELQDWGAEVSSRIPESFVFASERGTPLQQGNVWRRHMQAPLKSVGLGWCTFQVMRRTHATLMRQLGADPKLVSDQLGHSLDVSLNVYTQSPVERRLEMVNKLEQCLNSVQEPAPVSNMLN